MKRRDFSKAALLGAAALGGSLEASAEEWPVEGKQYLRLDELVPVSVPPGKFEVIEFFWYGCPHCFGFEPALDEWARKLPRDVVFTRMPVAFRNVPFVAHQRIYYALEEMGQLQAMHRKVFWAIHNDHLTLDQPADTAAFMAKNGIDATKFMQAYQSFGTQTKLTRANQIARAYKIDGVPSIGVHGRYFTSGPLAGSNERGLDVADALVQRLRRPT